MINSIGRAFFYSEEASGLNLLLSMFIKDFKEGDVVQWLEQRNHNPCAAGSNPAFAKVVLLVVIIDCVIGFINCKVRR